MNVYYIRHNWRDNSGKAPGWQSIIDRLYDNKEIGIHFQKIIPSYDAFDINKYKCKSGKTSINCLNKCSEEECLIVASYYNHDKIYIGKPIKGSKNTFDQNLKQIKYVKLQDDVRCISMQDFSLPFCIAPPFSTMVKWEMGKQAVNSFYFDETPELTLNLLLPWHSEILAEEWLRRNKLLRHKLYKTGGGMKDFDIVGLNEINELVVVQVKFECENTVIKEFLKKVEMMENTNGYFFTQKNDYKDERVISLGKVFNDFTNDKEYLRALIFGRLESSNKSPIPVENVRE